MQRLLTPWIAVRESFWLLPGAVILALALLALGLVELDRATSTSIAFGGDASAARGILSTVAGSLATVAGVTLSLTVVTFQLVAGQYSPRAVRTLVQDRMIQLTAGVFVGVVGYCLLVLRVIRGGQGDEEFVPRLSVTGAIALALAALVLLVVFVHHVASTIRVENIAADVARQTLSSLDELYPEQIGAPADDPDEPAVVGGALAFAKRPGFVQTITVDAFAGGLPAGSRLELLVAPGDFVTEHTPLASLRPPPDDPNAFEEAIREAVSVTSERTLEHDSAFGLRQLTDIALRAISPSINDPTTAIACIGYLGACVERLAPRALPARERAVGDATIVARRRRFEEYLEPFVELSRYARDDARVISALLDALAGAARVAASVGATGRVSAVRDTAEAVAQPAIADSRTDGDRERIERSLARVQQQV